MQIGACRYCMEPPGDVVDGLDRGQDEGMTD